MSNSRGTSVRRRCIDVAADGDGLLFAEGYDDAIVGIGDRNGEEIVVYDAVKVIRILRRRDRMSLDEAEEFFSFNVAGAWVGDRTPLFLRRI